MIRILIGFGALLAVGLTARAQYVWTTLNDPLAGNGTNGPDTLAANISGTNIVGGYGYFLRNNGVIHGFLLSGTNWITSDDPLAGSGHDQGTYVTAISGTNIVGWYVDSAGVTHGFLHNGSTWTTLDAPQADFSPSGGTDAKAWMALTFRNST